MLRFEVLILQRMSKCLNQGKENRMMGLTIKPWKGKAHFPLKSFSLIRLAEGVNNAYYDEVSDLGYN